MLCNWLKFSLCWNIGHVHIDLSNGADESSGGCCMFYCFFAYQFSLNNPIFDLHCEVLMVCAHDWQLESKEGTPMFQGEYRNNKKKQSMNCTKVQIARHIRKAGWIDVSELGLDTCPLWPEWYQKEKFKSRRIKRRMGRRRILSQPNIFLKECVFKLERK